MNVWIYFLKAKTINRIKIMNGDDTELLGVISDECATESQLHSMFARDRAQGEWFYPSDDLLAFIKKNAVSDHPAALDQHLTPYKEEAIARRAAERARPYPGWPTLPKMIVPLGQVRSVLCDAKYIQSLDSWDRKRLSRLYSEPQVNDRIMEPSSAE